MFRGCRGAGSSRIPSLRRMSASLRTRPSVSLPPVPSMPSVVRHMLPDRGEVLLPCSTPADAHQPRPLRRRRGRRAVGVTLEGGLQYHRQLSGRPRPPRARLLRSGDIAISSHAGADFQTPLESRMAGTGVVRRPGALVSGAGRAISRSGHTPRPQSHALMHVPSRHMPQRPLAPPRAPPEPTCAHLPGPLAVPAPGGP